MAVQLEDLYRNGLSGLEHKIQVVMDADSAPADAAAIAKLPSVDLGRGRYQIRARILLAQEKLPLKVVVFGQKVIWKAVMEVLPAAAKASRCEVDCADECRVQFPVQVHGLFRDEFGNVAPSEADVLQVSCSVQGFAFRVWAVTYCSFSRQAMMVIIMATPTTAILMIMPTMTTAR